MKKWVSLLLIGLFGLSVGGVATGFAEQFHGINYGPFHQDGQDPGTYTPIPPSQIQQDLGMIYQANFIHVKIFGLDNGLDRVVDIAKQYYPKLKIWLGVYEGSANHDDLNNTHATRWQMDRAISLASNYDNVVGIVVGAECLNGDVRAGDYWVTVSQLLTDLAYVNQGLLAAGVRSRVTLTTDLSWGAAHGDTSDPNGNIRQQLLADHSNINVWMINIYPYYADGNPLGIPCTEPEIRNNLDWNYNEFNGLYGATGKPIMVGEHGWPTAGDDYGRSHPGIGNQHLYFVATSKWFRERNWSAFFFEFFDEPWKATPPEPGGIGPYWGLCYKSGTHKWDLTGTVSSINYLLMTP
jgi:exo-beta-1,3-glucanase (GH17 family)